ncbi:hypothetical protein DL764_007744 [Monosporascus ibericus]|uniref:Chitin-binding type-1 domain-containing protein n=1 Tax=Monosporascus ibericus TaxID=155417 RepID=A0A4Q4SZ94_9PEZI|nr:hypothetical protein DL764_007744 [Monosporascus ibericus]
MVSATDHWHFAVLDVNPTTATVCNAAPPVTPPVTTPKPGDTSPDGSCGGMNQFNCTGSTFGACCSSGDWCGDTSANCSTGCQSLFGTCSAPSNVSSDGSCGSNGKICLGSGLGDCCSSSNYCGSSTAHCGTGCQAGFGNCTTTGGGGGGSGGAGDGVSTDGTCSGIKGLTCRGSTFGDCCSSRGFCGASTTHSGPGCQFGFGNCTAADNVLRDRFCARNGKTCKGSTFGDCCAASGFCGGSKKHRDAGCQPAFGNCSTTGSDISTDGACGKNGKTCKGSTFGDRCSSSGFCGGTSDQCGAGRQTGFGPCSSTGSDISTDGTCGKNGKSCKKFDFRGLLLFQRILRRDIRSLWRGMSVSIRQLQHGSGRRINRRHVCKERQDLQGVGIWRLLLVERFLRLVY